MKKKNLIQLIKETDELYKTHPEQFVNLSNWYRQHKKVTTGWTKL